MARHHSRCGGITRAGRPLPATSGPLASGCSQRRLDRGSASCVAPRDGAHDARAVRRGDAPYTIQANVDHGCRLLAADQTEVLKRVQTADALNRDKTRWRHRGRWRPSLRIAVRPRDGHCPPRLASWPPAAARAHRRGLAGRAVQRWTAHTHRAGDPPQGCLAHTSRNRSCVVPCRAQRIVRAIFSAMRTDGDSRRGQVGRARRAARIQAVFSRLQARGRGHHGRSGRTHAHLRHHDARSPVALGRVPLPRRNRANQQHRRAFAASCGHRPQAEAAHLGQLRMLAVEGFAKLRGTAAHRGLLWSLGRGPPPSAVRGRRSGQAPTIAVQSSPE